MSQFKFPLVKSTWNLSERNTFKKVINSNNYTMGKKTKLFEKNFADYFKAKYSVMVNSGSSANLIMIASLFYISKNKLKRGDEVIVPAISWSTTFSPLYQYGLKLVFVDVDINTLNFDLDKLKKAISKKTRLILAVNLLGNSNDFIQIKKLIYNKNIFLVEDNCQSMGTKFQQKYTGTFGIIGTFSSFFSHHINTMEGGIVLTNNKEIYHILLSLRAHGWIRDLPNDNFLKKKTGDLFSDAFCFVLPGYNLRPLEFSAALGIEQLKKLPNILVRRQKNAILFKKLMSNHKDIIIQKEIGKSSWFGFSLIIRPGSKLTRADLLIRLRKLGFETRPISAGNFARNSVLKYFNFRIGGNLENADYVDRNGLVIGNNHSDLSDAINKLKYI
jgi:CDP-6-deoxy-D-xylo-4-hexulose-3-dehydrase